MGWKAWQWIHLLQWSWSLLIEKGHMAEERVEGAARENPSPCPPPPTLRKDKKWGNCLGGGFCLEYHNPHLVVGDKNRKKEAHLLIIMMWYFSHIQTVTREQTMKTTYFMWQDSFSTYFPEIYNKHSGGNKTTQLHSLFHQFLVFFQSWCSFPSSLGGAIYMIQLALADRCDWCGQRTLLLQDRLCRVGYEEIIWEGYYWRKPLLSFQVLTKY